MSSPNGEAETARMHIPSEGRRPGSSWVPGDSEHTLGQGPGHPAESLGYAGEGLVSHTHQGAGIPSQREGSKANQGGPNTQKVRLNG